VTYPGRRAPTTEPDWLTLGQAAKFLGVAQSTIRKWSDQGRVPAFYTPGGHRRYRRRDLEAFLERSGPGGSTSTGSLKCLHAHAAFALARPGYELGDRILAELPAIWPDSCCTA